MAAEGWYYEEPLIDPRVAAYAEKHGLDAKALDWHLEADHGWEPHDADYVSQIEPAAQCMARGGCADD